jgi:hypothetical protein
MCKEGSMDEFPHFQPKNPVLSDEIVRKPVFLAQTFRFAAKVVRFLSK